MKMRQVITAAALLALAGLSGSSWAAKEGVVLIDQKKALAGDVTTGDGPGFPVTLSEPGSYRLSGNLTVPAGMHGVEISSSDITLDLNGFRISGGGNSATALVGTGTLARITILNGTLSDFDNGINLMSSSHVTVRDVRTSSYVSIVAGQHSLLQRNLAQGLIQANCPSVLTENITEGFMTVVILGGGAQCVRWNNRSLSFTSAVTQ